TGRGRSSRWALQRPLSQACPIATAFSIRGLGGTDGSPVVRLGAEQLVVPLALTQLRRVARRRGSGPAFSTLIKQSGWTTGTSAFRSMLPAQQFGSPPLSESIS